MRRIRRDESGVSLVIIALSLVALISVTALLIDGGAGFSDRRQVQNAVDSGALAGTNALVHYKSSVTTLDSNSIWSAVQTQVQSNGAGNNGDQLSCYLIKFDGSLITGTAATSDCSTVSGTNNPTANLADGVLVTAQDKKNTSFGQVFNAKTVTAGAHAAATIQPVLGGNSPFIICGNSGLGGYSFLNADDTPNMNPLTGGLPSYGYQDPVNNGPIAAGPTGLPASFKGTPPPYGRSVVLQGTAVDKSCGTTAASCKGKDDPSVPIIVPGSALCANGNGKNGTVLAAVQGQVPCLVNSSGNITNAPCDLLIPLASGPTGAKNGYTVVAWTAWVAFGNGNGDPKYVGQFIALASSVTGATGWLGSCTVGGAVPCVVHLIQ